MYWTDDSFGWVISPCAVWCCSCEVVPPFPCWLISSWVPSTCCGPVVVLRIFVCWVRRLGHVFERCPVCSHMKHFPLAMSLSRFSLLRGLNVRVCPSWAPLPLFRLFLFPASRLRRFPNHSVILLIARSARRAASYKPIPCGVVVITSGMSSLSRIRCMIPGRTALR